MNIEYTFVMDDVELHYEVDVDRQYDASVDRSDASDWTKLEHSQCSNCPLSKLQYKHCPAAIDLQHVVEDFQQLPAIKNAKVRVVTPQREYYKEAPLEEGLRSLMGLIMATSDCPILGKLKPNAQNHLPFASQEEFITRSASQFLLRQYFLYREGHRPDWDFQGLIRINQQLQLLNQAFWQRIHSACESDSNLKALLSFFNLSSSVSFSLETQLQKVRPKIMGEDDGWAMKDDRHIRLF
ncbi:MAG: hypothetical protein JKY67_12485 [Pseudomonadales bacterium]|nr:hypothetical protein [Pseudomonadales bacterium]